MSAHKRRSWVKGSHNLPIVNTNNEPFYIILRVTAMTLEAIIIVYETNYLLGPTPPCFGPGPPV